MHPVRSILCGDAAREAESQAQALAAVLGEPGPDATAILGQPRARARELCLPRIPSGRNAFHEKAARVNNAIVDLPSHCHASIRTRCRA